MALPSTLYATPAAWTDPNSALTDFVFVVDLSLLPQSWWDEVDTSDPTKGRLAKDDGTEIASDWQDFDDVAQTGFVWGIWSGTLATTGNAVPRVYPPKAANSSYASTATYGSEAVWVNYEFVLPLTESGNGTSGEYADATGNGYTGRGGGGTATRAPTQTTSDNPFGINWQDFDGTDDYIEIENSGNVFDNSFISISVIAKLDTGGGSDNAMLSNRYSSQGSNWFQLSERNANTIKFIIHDGSTEDEASFSDPDTGGLGTTTARWVHGTTSATNITLYRDGAQDAQGAITNDGQFSTSLAIRIGTYFDGSSARSFNGKIGFVKGYIGTLSADYISLEYQNQNDPATFWGTWSVEGGGGGTTALSGSLQSAFALSGEATKAATLSGDLPSAFNLAAGLQKTSTLQGAMQAALALDGELLKSATLSGTSTTASSLNGELLAKKILSGDITVASSVDGDLIVRKALAGDVLIVSSLSGNLTQQTAGVTSLSGSITTASSLSGSLDVTKALQGAIQSQTQLSGDLIKRATLQGDILTVFSLQGAAEIKKELQGTILISSDINGELSVLGQAWAGSIDISHKPLHKIKIQLKPLHKITIRQKIN